MLVKDDVLMTGYIKKKEGSEMDHQLFITIPAREMFKDGECTATCNVDGDETVATVKVFAEPRTIKVPATPKVDGLKVTYSESQQVVTPGSFNISVDGYMPAVCAGGDFGTEVQLRLMKKVVVPKIDINRLFASNPGSTQA